MLNVVCWFQVPPVDAAEILYDDVRSLKFRATRLGVSAVSVSVLPP
jgi:hypothetical protein